MPEPYGSATQWSPMFSRQQVGGWFLAQALNEHPGNIWFVDSTHASATDAAGYGFSPNAPLATVNYAVGLCTANNGDTIYAMPNHSETIATAGALDLDVQGIRVIGLGIGDDRPTLNWTAVDATVTVDDCDILIRNFMFTQGIDAIVTMFDVNSDDFTIEDCEWPEAAAAQAISFVDVDGGGANACDNFTMRRCRVIQTAAGADQVVDFAVVQDGAIIEDCYMDVDCENACIYSPAILTDVRIRNCNLHNRQTGDHAIEFSAAATGHIEDNHLAGDTIAAILDPGSCFCAGNTATTAIDSEAVPIPVTITDNAANILGANSANNTFDSTLVVDNADGSIIERQQWLQERTEVCVIKADGACLNGDDPIFTVAGGPVLVTHFFGLVTTVIGANIATMQIQFDVTTPAGTVNLSTAVAITDDAAGTSYNFTAATPGVLTPVTAGAFDQAPGNQWFLPVGTMQATGSAANTGVIAWYMVYKPLSPDSIVTAAA